MAWMRAGAGMTADLPGSGLNFKVFLWEMGARWGATQPTFFNAKDGGWRGTYPP